MNIIQYKNQINKPRINYTGNPLIKGVCLHNSAGYGNAFGTAEYNYTQYMLYLNTEKERYPKGNPSFAHYYVGSGGASDKEVKIVQLSPNSSIANHSGNLSGNYYYLSIEVCEDLGNRLNEDAKERFLRNEIVAIELIADLLKELNLEANDETIKFHKELLKGGTACPAKTIEYHGMLDGTIDLVNAKKYVVDLVDRIMKSVIIK